MILLRHSVTGICALILLDTEVSNSQNRGFTKSTKAHQDLQTNQKRGKSTNTNSQENATLTLNGNPSIYKTENSDNIYK